MNKIPDFPAFFRTVTGREPFPYQQRLAGQPWPDLMNIPTGLGKTAAVIVAWLYRRLNQDRDTPRRLVFCLPMRVLVEQTQRDTENWLQASEPLFKHQGLKPPTAHLLMGGDVDQTWAEHPEDPAILIGTQDMLLSRALMRGYGMSRYHWPVHFALLHSDALWVFDEVQIMGPGLTTAAQLAAFRHRFGVARPCPSLWMSATLNRQWLATVDLRPRLNQMKELTLDLADQAHPEVSQRLHAVKTLNPTATVLRSSAGEDYPTRLVREVLNAHRPGANTLVILNQVARAQSVFRLLKAQAPPGTEFMLLHGRFRPRERRALEAALQDSPGPGGRLIVATQAVEAGVDLSAAVLFTELAPWPSLAQRFGRCNRYGEYPAAAIHWIDIDFVSDDKLALPYDPPALASARARLQALTQAAPAMLPATEDSAAPTMVLRQRDLLDLFNTDPDLSGYDVDVGMYIRDGADSQAQAFWREFTGEPGELPPPGREELCPVAISQLAAYLKKTVRREKRRAWVWDSLGGRWRALEPEQLRPGIQVLLRAELGGYDPEQGFLPDHLEPVATLAPAAVPAGQRHDEDWRSQQRRFIELGRHLCHAEDEARALCRRLAEQQHQQAVRRAARWHDVGKAHPAFQNMLLLNAADAADRKDRLWAKGAGGGRAVYAVYGDDGARVQVRPRFRHELASLLAWLAQAPGADDDDLIAYLIAAHHGKVRLGLRALPGEAEPRDERRFARGVWEGDELPAVTIGDRETVAATRLELGIMMFGEGAQGASWQSRTRRLLDRHGPFRLAWLETLVRLADWRASAREQTEETKTDEA